MLSRICTALILFLVPTTLYSQERFALLIGNKDYKQGVGALGNPHNDVRIVAEALKTIGFEVLKPVENASRALGQTRWASSTTPVTVSHPRARIT